MDIRFYNALTHRVDLFAPVAPPAISIYSCGPTVYDYAHIGNFRSFLFCDVLSRFLSLAGFDVNHVMNLTDVGHMTEDQLADGGGQDKMQKAAERLVEDKKAGKVPDGAIADPNNPYEVARFFIDAFLDDARALGLKVADRYDDDAAASRMPRATDHVTGSMIPMIAGLIEKRHAYVGSDGAVYFSVESFPDYGALSGNTIDQIQGGAGGRVDAENQAAKKHPADFLLWKPDPSHLMKWDSPWGTGYPGWHIECSAMARAKLGCDVIDIHTGGEDNIFPHHECEIAQTRGATGCDSFARFWMHARFLLVNGEKMSKSKGNFYTARDVFAGNVSGRPVHPVVLRYELIKSSYRANLNFTDKGLGDSAQEVRRLNAFAEDVRQRAGGNTAEVDLQHPVLGAFAAALADDLNMAAARAVLFDWIASKPDNAHEALAVWEKVDSVLAIGGAAEEESSGPDDDLAAKAKQIDDARAAKDYDAADRVRQELIDAGLEVKTTKDGTVVTRPLA